MGDTQAHPQAERFLAHRPCDRLRRRPPADLRPALHVVVLRRASDRLEDADRAAGLLSDLHLPLHSALRLARAAQGGVRRPLSLSVVSGGSAGDAAGKGGIEVEPLASYQLTAADALAKDACLDAAQGGLDAPQFLHSPHFER